MPSAGESVTEGTVLSWLKQEGDAVQADEPLVEVSTDKVDAEIPSPASGTLTKILVKADETVQVGGVLAEIEQGEGGDTAPAEPQAEGNGASPAEAAEATEATGETVDVTFPEMGDSVAEGTILEWRVKAGDTVAVDDPLVEISTDKVDAEVPSPVAGTIAEVLAEADQTVAVGSVLCRIAASDGAPAGGTVSPTAEPSEERPAADTPTPAGNGAAAGEERSPSVGRASTAAPINGAEGAEGATPVAARMAASHGIDISKLSGSGPRGRITKDDVQAVIDGNGAPDGASGEERSPSVGRASTAASTSPIRGPAATLARFMDESLSIPTATSFRTLEVDTLAERRAALKAAGRKLSFTHLIAWAIVQAARDMPVMANSFAEVDGKPHRVTPGAISLGLAVDMQRKDGSRSLVVPVIRDASTLSFESFVTAYDEAVFGARDNKLAPDAYQGAQITLTNPGGIGTVASVPRLMPGQGTIVATGAIGYPAGLTGVDAGNLGELGVTKVMTMTSTYDHRVIQGAESGAFLKRVDELLQGQDGFYEKVLSALGVDADRVESDGGGETVTAAEPVPAAAAPAATSTPDEALLQAVQAATSVVKAHRTHGHLAARLDPLGSEPRGDPAIDPASVNLTPELMGRIPASVLRVAVPGKTFADALPHLAETYTGTIAYELEHIAGHKRRVWLRQAIESGQYRQPLSEEEKKRLLGRLSQVEALESYLHKAFLGKKQFSIEGLDVLVPMLDETIELSSASGARQVTLGMAHRGRLNVLAHTVGRPYESILVEFEGEQNLSAGTGKPEGGTGDVKYHYGATGTYRTQADKGVAVHLSPNPSHLEYVNPVIEGRVRAEQTSRKGREISHDPSVAVPVLIHGDGAFPGQGVVAETLNLQALRGYSTGGTVHIIANNQLGFTTDPIESRSTRYASDLAKGFDIPVIHVNADDVEACIHAVRLAVAFRNEFGRDALIDLIGYRRFGHNETDEPAYTQPAMYELIKKHPPVREVYARRLEQEGVVSAEETKQMADEAYGRVSEAHASLKESMGGPPDTGQHEIDRTMSREPRTTLPQDLLLSVNEQISKVPEGFNVHRKLKSFLDKRREVSKSGGPVDWAHAESLAFGSLLALGVPIRLTGQDTERGTFSQRHLVLHDAESGEPYCPLQNLHSAVSPFELHNSPLSEQGCLGFEYGYSLEDPDALVLWEAQFGDFVNSAQVIIDQFLTSGLAKWGLSSRLTLLLPHGYEGSGPEHSSGRVERFLQACAEGNMRVANCTTPAQYFHLLRRQAIVLKPRPLVLMTPKSLLRLPAATSTMDELADGAFQRVIDDRDLPGSHEDVTKLVLCSGKVYYDIVGNEDRGQAKHIAVARVEMLYPFPENELQELIESYPNLERVYWVQEEPRNMGPRAFMRRRMAAILPEELHYYYVGRQLRAAPGEGYAAAHRKEQDRIVRVALDLEEDTLEPDASAERKLL
ncbi:MAG TPA: multifunctional oxoglutarate decarboxylase/oxoglutarate dehydrogenase thiamine pyrophosphate-binding subunit/dihydrolipoyllysine-residue succinyltransferase subunit [Thermoleophilaceae bacterium]|nr:multifunctional oxoglutarate decarboxylase/oxoglutarate dehydrogenase thiamine pyrophosphate-binding subunit/dihydrolipoyllysine-residue succinyltransferase subunit [Thermoleophilaceae bacterium]